ncbi:tetratricopeptide repeat protein [Streptomyces sp. NBC_01408]|uniref:tetratricopeptide repeat protein n=1 Tax=Streptomyces sp. NBC_01408 TaxID=2903855 RepID=UPI00224E9AD7|nr:tetratricopeptide repeat protein [Streptomyces sp. NBC_01408]MCX4691341.1 tetratricopeptide repeat protein [Streptomyces sp. NBC_01408]
MRDSHRGEAERLLGRAVEEEGRRAAGGAGGPGAPVDRAALLARGKEALDALAASAAPEYEAYVRALDEAAAGNESLGEAFRRNSASTALLVTAVAAAAAVGADLALGVAAGTALTAGAVAGVAGAAATVAKVTALHLPAANRRAGELGRPGGPEQLKLQWLSALEVRGIRPFLEQQRTVAAAARTPRPAPRPASPQLRGTDRSAEARRRSVLEQSFGQLPDPAGVFVGRRAELTRIAQWVQAARASTETRPVVVVLHGEPGVGRTALALRAAHGLRDQFRGACVVDLRGGSPSGEAPLSTREALLHLLNRLGAPREQLLFREGASAEQQVRRLCELYHQHLQGLPVTVVLDDAVDVAQVRLLVPERSESLVLVTAREPMELPADLAAWVHQLPVEPLAEADAAELVRGSVAPGAGAPVPVAPGSGAQGAGGPGSGAQGAGGPGPVAPGPVAAAAGADVPAALLESGGGLPLALRMLAPLAPAGEAPWDGPGDAGVHPVERALRAADARLAEPARQLLRRLPLAGRASLGGAAAAALADVPEQAALRTLEELWEAGLIERVRGQRFRMHDAVRAYAAARLAADEDRAESAAAHGRLIRNYAKLADSVIRMVDGKMSTRADTFLKGSVGGHGFTSLDAALRWLDDESSFITAALRHSEGVDQQAVLDLLGALCDFCLLRGDLYRLGEIDELTQAVAAAAASDDGNGAAGGGQQGRLVRSVRWRTGIAARQLGELDKARTTLTSVVDEYMEAHQEAGAAMALVSLGITLHHQGNLPEAAVRIREALVLQEPPELAGDRAWGLHALAAVERDLAHLGEATALLHRSLALHRESESVHGEAWAHFQLGQVYLRLGEVAKAEVELRLALDLYGRTRDDRGEAWALTQLGRARVVDGDPGPAVERLREALVRHREAEDARGEAWTLYYLGQALEEGGERDQAVRELERARTMFSRMRDVYGLAHARHHSGRVTRDQRAAQTGNLRNSGFARQLLVDARADFRRIGLAHGEAWTCLELAVVDAGNAKVSQALGLCEEAVRLFISYGDRRGEDWARFLRCTLLPYAIPGAPEEARAELARLAQAPHPARDGRLADCLETYGVVLGRGVDPSEGWQAWRLGLVPNLHAREIMGVPVPAPPT